jgi:hypothetical protein
VQREARAFFGRVERDVQDHPIGEKVRGLLVRGLVWGSRPLAICPGVSSVGSIAALTNHGHIPSVKRAPYHTLDRMQP